jgi:signal transduction histidine kinase
MSLDKVVAITGASSGIKEAIAKQIIQAHNGQITVESSLGKGTKFKIFLPIV